jgi:hypothetical protein
MPLYSGRAKSKVRSGYNWSEGSVIIQKEEEISGPLNPDLNILPFFEKMFHRLFLQGVSFYFITKNNECKGNGSLAAISLALLESGGISDYV